MKQNKTKQQEEEKKSEITKQKITYIIHTSHWCMHINSNSLYIIRHNHLAYHIERTSSPCTRETDKVYLL